MSRESVLKALVVIILMVTQSRLIMAQTTEGVCIPNDARQVLSCADDELGDGSGSAGRPLSIDGHVATRRVQEPNEAVADDHREPAIDAPTTPPGVARRRNVTVELLRREVRLLSQLVGNTPSGHRELPGRLLRLAQGYEELASAMRDRVRALDQPIFEAGQEGDRQRVVQLTAEQRAQEQQEVRWRVEAIGQYRRLGRDFPDFPHRDEVLFRQGASLEELAEGERLRGATPGAQSREPQLRQEARRAYQELIRSHPSSPFVPHAYLSFAEHYFHEGDMSAALRLYERAAQDQSSTIFGYVTYKRAWCHINLQHDREALSDFVRVIQWAAANPGGPMARPLARSARAELIPPFSRTFGPAQAWAFFGRIGGAMVVEMMEDLAQFYFDQGQWSDAVAAYRTLMANNESSDHLCQYQTRVAHALQRGRTLTEQSLELRRTVDLMDTFVTAHHPEAAKGECRREVAELLVDVATSWHQETVGSDTSPGTGDEETMRAASAVYDMVISRFSDLDDLDLEGWSATDRPTLYRLSYWAAELSFRRRLWSECGPAFDRVVAMGRDGEHLRDAAYGAVLCYDNLYQQTRVDEPPSNQGESGREPTIEELQPRDLTQGEEAMSRAFRRYTCHVTDGEDRVRVAFRRAMIFYSARRFSEAALLFGDLTSQRSSHELAPLAARYHVDALNAIRRLHQDRATSCEDEIDGAAERYLADRHIGQDPDIVAEFTTLRCGVRWFRAERRAQAGDHAGCAEQYLELYRDFGQQCPVVGDHGQDEVLSNAALCLEADDRIGPAIQVRRRLIAEYGEGSEWAQEHGVPSPLALRAEVQIGGNYHAIAAYTKAAEHYERFARQYPGEEDAPEALQNATVFWLGLGQHDRALQASKVFESNYGRERPSETATVAGAVGSIYMTTERWSEAEHHYRGLLARYGTRAPLDEVIAARVNLGTALWHQRGHNGKGTSSSVSSEFQRAAALADRGRADGETPTQRLGRYRELIFGNTSQQDIDETRRLVRMVNAVAKARFYLAEEEYERFAAIELPSFRPGNQLSRRERAFLITKRGRGEARLWEQALRSLDSSERQRQIAQAQFETWTERELIPWVKRRDTARARAEAAYIEVVREEVPEWEIAAAARIGEMYRVMMQSFYDTPLPPIVRDDQELMDIWETTLNERAEPYREAAIRAYGHCLEEATRNRWFNSWSRDCEGQLHTFDPRQYPMADEFRTDADHQGAPLASPQFVRSLENRSDQEITVQ